ncbi:MAG: hypothetical protein JWP36_718 [Paucimonas sp.]|nr:hypothetical protein [Paucimonas sp.]
MTRPTMPTLLRLLAAAALLAGASLAAQAQASANPSPQAGTEGAPVFASPEQARQAIEAVQVETDKVERAYQAERSACFRKFLTTACLDSATDRRRATLTRLRDTEVAAQAWLRRDKATRRDEALAQRRADDERDARDREQEIKTREAALERKRLASEQRQREGTK